MSFDAHSLERLAALGRTLPTRLPAPGESQEATADAALEAGGKSRRPDRRHRLETEQDPTQLFHELMRASTDGTVPPHLLDRLRDLERQPAATPPPSGKSRSAGPGRSGGPRRGASPRDAGSETDDSLYTAFSQLLLEEEDEDGD